MQTIFLKQISLTMLFFLFGLPNGITFLVDFSFKCTLNTFTYFPAARGMLEIQLYNGKAGTIQ